MARAKDQPTPFRLVAESTFTDADEVEIGLDKLKQKGARIIFGSFNETWARVIFCQVRYI